MEPCASILCIIFPWSLKQYPCSNTCSNVATIRRLFSFCFKSSSPNCNCFFPNRQIWCLCRYRASFANILPFLSIDSKIKQHWWHCISLPLSFLTSKLFDKGAAYLTFFVLLGHYHQSNQLIRNFKFSQNFIKFIYVYKVIRLLKINKYT